MSIKLLRAFGTITRVDEESRTVEGYAFVNPDCGDGIILPRAVMEEATEDYAKWSNVREMHGASAVGVSTVEWDETGALMRAEVVDDAAWEKVKKGVYKGFSVGVKVLQAIRGGDGRITAKKAVWYETSLVDRPKDPDSSFILARAEGDDTVETEIIDETPAADAKSEFSAIVRGYLMAKLQADEPATLIRNAFSAVENLFWGIRYGDGMQIPEGGTMRSAFIECMNDVRDYVAPLIDQLPVKRAEGEEAPMSIETALRLASESIGITEEVKRFEEAASAAETRAVAAETRITTMDAELVELRAQVVKLENEPDPNQAKPFGAGLSEDKILEMSKAIEARRKEAEKPKTPVIENRDWANVPHHEKEAALIEFNRAKSAVSTG